MSLADLERALGALADALADELGDASGPLGAVRREGREAFAAQGLPTTKLEEWKYTNLAPLAAVAPGLALAADAGSEKVPTEPLTEVAARLVFVNGLYREDLSKLPHDPVVHVERLAEADASVGVGTLASAKDHALVALNAALLRDGALVRIEPHTQPPLPIHLVFAGHQLSSPLSVGRVVVEVGEGARAVVVEDHLGLGDGAGIVSAVTELHVGANAQLEHVLLERTSDEAFVLSHTAARLERDARLTTHTLTLGGRLVRNDLEALLAGEGGECALRGLTVGRGDALVDNHTLVDHAVPHCRSDELYKTVLGGRSTGVFRGRVIVRPHAQKTDARQSNPNLLLSNGAEVDTKPQLEIYADDVKCSHGSSIGRIDEDALFYLRSRGIDAREARALLTRGFISEILQALPVDELGVELDVAFAERLAQSSEEGEERT